MVELKLPGKLVRLTTKDNQPAIVIRNGNGELETQVVPSHKPYAQALIKEVADRHRGAFKLLANYDRRGR